MGTLRIIAGSFRGRRIRVPEGAVRPTGERVRESVFNILGQSAEGLDVLDLYAGSGALGLEALSRGARRAVFVESDARALKALEENLGRLHVETKANVVRGKALAAVRSGRLGGFDLVFADPPYADRSSLGLLTALDESGAVRPGGVAVLEQDAGGPPADLPEGWSLVREARYGRTVVRFYRRLPATAPAGPETRS